MRCNITCSSTEKVTAPLQTLLKRAKVVEKNAKGEGYGKGGRERS